MSICKESKARAHKTLLEYYQQGIYKTQGKIWKITYDWTYTFMHRRICFDREFVISMWRPSNGRMQKLGV